MSQINKISNFLSYKNIFLIKKIIEMIQKNLKIASNI